MQGFPNVIKWLIFAVLAALGIVLWMNADRLHVYKKYFFEKSPSISLRYEDLSADMGEAEILKHFAGAGLRCINQSKASNGMGDRVCYASIDRADDFPAMTVATFSNGGRLNHVLVQVPNWAHTRWLDRFVGQYGKADRDGRVDGMLGGPVLRWGLPNGKLNMSRERDLNPMQWGVLLWVAAEVKN